MLGALARRRPDVPVLVLTARGSWHEKVQGIDGGADDYVAKPFQIEEVLARVRALIRRAAGHARRSCVRRGRARPRLASVTRDGVPVKLTSHEFRVLSYLMHHRGRVVSQAELTEHIYAQDFDRDSNTVEVFVARLRRKLGAAPSRPCAASATASAGRAMKLPDRCAGACCSARRCGRSGCSAGDRAVVRQLGNRIRRADGARLRSRRTSCGAVRRAAWSPACSRCGAACRRSTSCARGSRACDAGASGAGRRVSDRSAAARRRPERAARAARAVAGARAAKAGDLAHGLKTPLAVLAQEAERAAAAGQPELGAAIREQVDRMRRQVDYHLAHARAAASAQGRAGAARLWPPSVDGLVRTLQRLHAERGLTIESTSRRTCASASTRGPRRDARQPARQRLQVGARRARVSARRATAIAAS